MSSANLERVMYELGVESEIGRVTIYMRCNCPPNQQEGGRRAFFLRLASPSVGGSWQEQALLASQLDTLMREPLGQGSPPSCCH